MMEIFGPVDMEQDEKGDIVCLSEREEISILPLPHERNSLVLNSRRSGTRQPNAPAATVELLVGSTPEMATRAQVA